MKKRMIQCTNTGVSRERLFVNTEGNGVLTRRYHDEAEIFLG